MTKLRPEDGSLAALYARTDGDAESIRELMRRMRIIHDNTTEDAIRKVAADALRMSWLLGEVTP